MTGPTSRLGNLRAIAGVICALAIALGVVLAAMGFTAAHEDHRLWFLVGGGGLVLAGVTVWLGAALLLKIESNTFRAYGQLLDMHEMEKRRVDLLESIAQNTALSDAAKALTNREKDCESLRTAIRSELLTEQWEAALALADGMANRFGYVEEAQSLRAEIFDARTEAMRRCLDEAHALVQKHLAAFEWEKAQSEIERLRRALPDEPRIAKLSALYESSRQARKAELNKAWEGAVVRNDVDEAIAVIRELDAYLTRDEARALEESAREVFKAKLVQFGMQFQFAVNEKRWRDAIEIGLHIIEEFPNSRMSKEVANAMDELRTRAGLHGDVEVTAGQSPKSNPARG